jgi:hypothetical protein
LDDKNGVEEISHIIFNKARYNITCTEDPCVAEIEIHSVSEKYENLTVFDHHGDSSTLGIEIPATQEISFSIFPSKTARGLAGGNASTNLVIKNTGTVNIKIFAEITELKNEDAQISKSNIIIGNQSMTSKREIIENLNAGEEIEISLDIIIPTRSKKGIFGGELTLSGMVRN